MYSYGQIPLYIYIDFTLRRLRRCVRGCRYGALEALDIYLVVLISIYI